MATVLEAAVPTTGAVLPTPPKSMLDAISRAQCFTGEDPKAAARDAILETVAWAKDTGEDPALPCMRTLVGVMMAQCSSGAPDFTMDLAADILGVIPSRCPNVARLLRATSTRVGRLAVLLAQLERLRPDHPDAEDQNPFDYFELSNMFVDEMLCDFERVEPGDPWAGIRDEVPDEPVARGKKRGAPEAVLLTKRIRCAAKSAARSFEQLNDAVFPEKAE